MTDPVGRSWQSLLPGNYGMPTPVITTPEIGVPPVVIPDDSAHPIAEGVEIDGAQLQEDLVRALGRDVAITVADSGLTIADPATGLPLDADRALVAQVLAEHAPAESDRVRFLREYDTAKTLEGKLGAFRDLIARQVAEEDRARVLHRRAQERLAAALTASVTVDQPVRPPVPPRVTSRNPWTQRAQRGEV